MVHLVLICSLQAVSKLQFVYLMSRTLTCNCIPSVTLCAVVFATRDLLLLCIHDTLCVF
jgi:hypothetical protein